MARDLELYNLLTAQPLVINGKTSLGQNFPMGEGWYRASLRFNLALTIGSGSGAIAEGELLIIKNILLRTSRGEILCNMGGRGLWKFAAIKSHTLPRKDAVAAASATYRVDLPLFFADERMVRPEDTILDTARYNGMSLEITLGGVADLLTTVGTSALVATIDMDVMRTKGPLHPKARPIFHIQYDNAPVQDANSGTVIELERSDDLAYKRLLVHECASGTAGVPFSGANADDVKDLESLRDQSGFIMQQRSHEMIQNQNKLDFHLESVLAGFTVVDFCADGSINSSLLSAGRSRLQYTWTNKAGVAANDLVTVGYEAVRTLK